MERKRKQVFALFLAGRSTFPASLLAGAAREVTTAVEQAGYGCLLPPKGLLSGGAVSSRQEGEVYAQWLRSVEGQYDGVLMSLPNFGDENGAAEAMTGVQVPIFIHAYPDEAGKMDIASRRDAYCGKISIMNALRQRGIPFTVFEPHVVRPETVAFAENLREFASVCRMVNGGRRMRIGAIGARATAFKTVRYDEAALEKLGVTVETYDLLYLYERVATLRPDDARLEAKRQRLIGYADCSCVPPEKLARLCAVGVALDEIISADALDAVAIRCWNEMETTFGIAPCLLLSELSDRFVEGVCETDICNAAVMRLLRLGAERPAVCLDWNNNYGDEPDKCILFHCGPVAGSLMRGKGKVTDHSILANSFGAGCGWGCNQGRIADFPMTYASAKTENGRFALYLGEGHFTDDPIDGNYFGCAGVAEIPGLQQKLIRIGREGYKHHMSAAPGHFARALREACEMYLGYDIAAF